MSILDSVLNLGMPKSKVADCVRFCKISTELLVSHHNIVSGSIAHTCEPATSLRVILLPRIK